MFILLLAGCTKSVDKEETPTSHSVTVQPFQGLKEVQELMVSYGEDSIHITAEEEWTSDDLTLLDQAGVWRFIENLIQLEGQEIEKVDSNLILYVELQEGNGNKKEVSFYEDSNEQFYLETDNHFAKVEQLPIEMQAFSPVYFMPSITYDLSRIEEIQFVSEEESFRLNQDSPFSEVESAPFVSGWFLHDAFETAFSVEYYQMEKILSNLLELKGEPIEKPLSFTEDYQVRITDGQKNEAFQFGVPHDGWTPLHLEYADQWYKIPEKLAQSFNIKAFQIIDNFIALIPLDSLISVVIESETETFHIEANHQLIMDVNDKPKIVSTFYLNNKKIEEQVFRSTYQYLAALHYSEVATAREREATEDPAIQIQYQFQSEGEPMERSITFYETNEEQFLVQNNIITEFISEKKQFDLLLEKLQELEK